jgi:hypothetical protein
MQNVATLEPTSVQPQEKRASQPLPGGYGVVCRHAVVIRPEDLRFFVSKISAYYACEPTDLRVGYRGGRWTDLTLDELLESDDPSSIVKVEIITGRDAAQRCVVLSFDSGEAKTELEISGPADEADRLHRSLVGRLRRMRPFYSPLAKDGYALLMFFAMMLCAVGIADGAWRLAIGGGLLTVLFFPLLWKWLFPRVAFAFGVGERRHRAAAAVRSIVFGTLGLSSIVGPLLYGLVVGF